MKKLIVVLLFMLLFVTFLFAEKSDSFIDNFINNITKIKIISLTSTMQITQSGKSVKSITKHYISNDNKARVDRIKPKPKNITAYMNNYLYTKTKKGIEKTRLVQGLDKSLYYPEPLTVFELKQLLEPLKGVTKDIDKQGKAQSYKVEKDDKSKAEILIFKAKDNLIGIIEFYNRSGELTKSITFSEYGSFSGITFPTKLTEKYFGSNKLTKQITYSSITINQEIKDEIFQLK